MFQAILAVTERCEEKHDARALVASRTSGENMTAMHSILRKDALVLAIYFALIVALLISEKAIGATVSEKWLLIVGSVAYVYFIGRNHWIASKSNDVNGLAIRFIGIGLIFMMGGLFLSFVLGVNLKFLLGIPI